jgi:hypothetical protein
MDLLIRLIIWLVKQCMKSSEQVPQYTPPRVETPERSLSREVAKMAARLPSIKARAQRHLAQLDEHEADLRAHVAPVLEEGVLARVAELEQDRTRVLQTIETDGVHSAMPLAQHYVDEIQRLERVPAVTKEILRQRSVEADRAVLGDADALAIACYRPILDFARRHNLPIESNQPITLFYQGGTFIELAFLEYKLAPIGLPESYRTSPWRWPAIAHEIAHDFYASLQDLGQELVEKLELELDEQTSVRPGDEAFDRLLCRIWLEEIFADVAGALMIGPAYLRAMTAIFRQPGAPETVVAIHVSPDGVIDVHPPRHLRVHMTAHFLERQGFGNQARDLCRTWDEEHRDPPELALTTPTTRQGLPLAPLLERCEAIANRLYDMELRSLAGHRLADIPGLDFSKLHVRRAERAAQRLSEGQPVAFDARALIAAATSASLDNPDRVELINEATRLSIVGVGTGERAAGVRALSARFRFRGERGSSRRANARRIVEALLLEEILEGRGRRQRAGGSRGATGA